MALVLALSLLTGPGCGGNFNLTRKLWYFNTDVGKQWAQELAFVGLMILPYPIASLGDMLIFNSFEFWARRTR